MTRMSPVVALLWGLCWTTLLPAQTPKPPHVVFVVSEDEYHSEVTMPMIAKILEAKHGMRTTVITSPQESKGDLPGLEALATADAAVFFLRHKELSENQFQLIKKYVDSGKPIVGLRTSTDAFHYPTGHKLARWNYQFGIEVFGQKWLKADARTSSTDVSIIPAEAKHPILRGIPPKFHVRSWLYQVLPLEGNCTPLLRGDAVKGTEAGGATFGSENPVAWTKERKNGRTFFTTLGHPQDFEQEPVRRLLINGIYWSLGKEIPSAGTNAEIQGKYIPPPEKK